MDNKPEVIDPSELLTLCMPTYNRVVNVCAALEDIIPKIRPYNFRLIVVDNCSPANTRKVVEAYQGLYDRLEYFGQDENKGYDINGVEISENTVLLGNRRRKQIAGTEFSGNSENSFRTNAGYLYCR